MLTGDVATLDAQGYLRIVGLEGKIAKQALREDIRRRIAEERMRA